MKGLAAQLLSILYTHIPLPHVCTQACSRWHCEHEGTREISQVHAAAILAGSGNETGAFCCTKMAISKKCYASMNYFILDFFSAGKGV